jgi:hypothetical protein
VTEYSAPIKRISVLLSSIRHFQYREIRHAIDREPMRCLPGHGKLYREIHKYIPLRLNPHRGRPLDILKDLLKFLTDIEFDYRFGVVDCILACYARGRGFLRSTNICVHENVYSYWVWVVCVICMYMQIHFELVCFLICKLFVSLLLIFSSKLKKKY